MAFLFETRHPATDSALGPSSAVRQSVRFSVGCRPKLHTHFYPPSQGGSADAAGKGLPRRLPAPVARHRLVFLLLLAYGLFFLFPGTSTQAQVPPPEPGQQPLPTDRAAELTSGWAVTPTIFRAAAARIRPAIVTIESFAGASTLQGRIGGIRRQGEGNTTGVMISPDGLVVSSAFNFIQQPTVITVVTSDGQRRIARMLGRDDTRQICLLQVEGCSEMPVAESVDPTEVVVGQWAMSVGLGYGDATPALSLGIISAKNRAGGRALQTDANISPANYGGPLIDARGRMIGICVPLDPNSLDKGAGVQWYDSGIGFAIPLHGLETRLAQMRAGENFYPAYLGVVVEPSATEPGLRITQVDSLENRLRAIAAQRAAQAAKSDISTEQDRQTVEQQERPEEYDYPAFAAGLKEGDILRTVAGQAVTDIRGLRIILGRHNAGDEISLEISRGEQPQTIAVTLGRPPKTALQANQLPSGPPPGN